MMQNINTYIIEKLNKINSKNAVNQYNYFPKDRIELRNLIDKLIKERGIEANLNDIDTSRITNMDYMFYGSSFNGDISNWDVSNVKDMSYMFGDSSFNGDISEWDVSNVKNMYHMFWYSLFNGENGDISNWNISSNININHIKYMFKGCPLEKNPPKWYEKFK